jgi:hypothetical protein
MKSPSRLPLVGICVLALFASVLPARAQGIQTGVITGTVASMDGLSLPGVTVTATSPNLQGPRSAVSDANGVYYLRGLSPGPYLVTLEIPSFQTVSREDVEVNAGGVATVDVTMALAGVTETVTVNGEAPSLIATPRTSQTYSKNEVDVLPVGRRPLDIAELSPGVTTTVFNISQVALSGSFGYDNVFMVNGVDINDNLFGTPNNLFIEDAVEETTVLTHGISAQYGRFSGGVINIVTRSGSNTFSGSFREGLSNPAWIGQTPLEKTGNIKHVDVLSKTHEGTFGGPLVRDKLWLFAAGRYETANLPNTFAQNGAGYTRTDTNRRGELKITGTFAASQTVQASFIGNATEQVNASALNAAALLDASMLTTRQLPNRLMALNYHGSITPLLYADAQYSEKKQSVRNNGGTSLDIRDSPFRTAGVTPGVPGALVYNAPYLDATDPESRNNRQFTGSLAYLLATSAFGSHELKGGGEYFVNEGIGGNSQSSTGIVFVTDYLTSGGAPVRDATGKPVPVFAPGLTEIWTFIAKRGAEINIRTTSLYLQDRWVATRRLTLDLGTRLETVNSDATGTSAKISATSIVPRLGMAYDLQGNGSTVLFATYGHYAGKYSQVQFGVNTNVGRPDEVDYSYSGPAGQGFDFAPGFDRNNYRTVSFAAFPTANVMLADGVKSPLTKEFTAGIGRELGTRAQVRATYAWRSASRFVEDFIDLSRGITDIPLVGPATNRVYDNVDGLDRRYQALLVQGGYRLRDNLRFDGHYTAQLRNEGNFPGEAANQPGMPSIYGNYPEIFGPALDRLLPEGRFDNFQRHKLRLTTMYNQSLGRFGSVDVAPVWRVNSGGVYSLTANIALPAVQRARNPGYPAADINPTTRETVFFGERGGYDFKGYGMLDLATSYNLSVWRTLRPWFKVEVYNLLNNTKLIAWDRTVTANATSTLDANGIPTAYVQGPRFGQATAGNHFPQPWPGQNGARAVRLAFGVRF